MFKTPTPPVRVVGPDARQANSPTPTMPPLSVLPAAQANAIETAGDVVLRYEADAEPLLSSQEAARRATMPDLRFKLARKKAERATSAAVGGKPEIGSQAAPVAMTTTTTTTAAGGNQPSGKKKKKKRPPKPSFLADYEEPLPPAPPAVAAAAAREENVQSTLQRMSKQMLEDLGLLEEASTSASASAVGSPIGSALLAKKVAHHRRAAVRPTALALDAVARAAIVDASKAIPEAEAALSALAPDAEEEEEAAPEAGLIEDQSGGPTAPLTPPKSGTAPSDAPTPTWLREASQMVRSTSESNVVADEASADDPATRAAEAAGITAGADGADATNADASAPLRLEVGKRSWMGARRSRVLSLESDGCLVTRAVSSGACTNRWPLASLLRAYACPRMHAAGARGTSTVHAFALEIARPRASGLAAVCGALFGCVRQPHIHLKFTVHSAAQRDAVVARLAALAAEQPGAI